MERGQQGETGVMSLAGADGIQGETGFGIGIRGQQGERGETGIQGVAGNNGATGIQGQRGQQGHTGIMGIGHTGVGSKGETGLSGPTGIQGVTGPVGSAGVGVYTITLDANGCSGTIPPNSPNVLAGNLLYLPDPRWGLTPPLGKVGTGGWNTATDGSGQDYFPGRPYTPESSFPLYVKLVDDLPTSYTVTYDAVAGIGAPSDSNSYYAGDEVTVLGDPTPAEGYC